MHPYIILWWWSSATLILDNLENSVILATTDWAAWLSTSIPINPTALIHFYFLFLLLHTAPFSLKGFYFCSVRHVLSLEYNLWPQIQGEKKAVEGIRYKGVFGTISTMIRTEGPKSLYNGLVAGLQRQVCFASVRIGLYDNVKDFYTGGKDSMWYVQVFLF